MKPKNLRELSTERTEAAVKILIRWYEENKADYPWRREPTPYRVWISEIMLQQTRIEAAKPYFERFVAELPTPRALAQVSDERLMKLWQGLGYYSRARNLKKAAQKLVEQYGGELPCDHAALLSLNGIGEYTAGAIASIAFGLPFPAVDGNVLRVMARLHALHDDVTNTAFKKTIAAHLQSLYPSGNAAGKLTEGLMELGERVCTAGTPHCDDCPLFSLCLVRERGCTDMLPIRAKPKERKIETMTVLLISMNGKYALRRRESGLLGGLWEFPNLPQTQSPEAVAETLSSWGLCPHRIVECGTAKHCFSHVEWHMNGYLVECEPNEQAHDEEPFVWANRREIHESFAVPTAFRAYLALL